MTINEKLLENKMNTLSEQIGNLDYKLENYDKLMTKILWHYRLSNIFSIATWIFVIVATFGLYYYLQDILSLFGIDSSFLQKIYMEWRSVK